MKKRDNSYWSKRQEQMLLGLDKHDAFVEKWLNKEYEAYKNQLSKEIAYYYQQYGIDNVLGYKDMMAKLSNSEKEAAFQNYNKFIKKYPEYAKYAPIRDSIYKLNRIEAMKLNIMMQQVEIGALEEEVFKKHLEKSYNYGYLSTLKNLGYPEGFHTINNNAMLNTLSQKWFNDKNYSDRIWDNKEKFRDFMLNDLRNGIIAGDSYDKIVNKLLKRFDTEKFNARRLVWTESAFMMNQGNAQAFINDGIERYQYSAIMDDRTSSTCQSLNNEKFYFKDMVPGENFPPTHSFCRSTIIPIENDSKKLNSFVEDASNDTGQVSIDAIMDQTNMKTAVGKDNYQNFLDYFDKIDNKDARNLFRKLGHDISFYPLKNGGAFARGANVQLSNESFIGRIGKNALETVFHEIGHAFDYRGLKILTGSDSVQTGRVIKRKVGGRIKWFDETISHASGLPKYGLRDKINREFWQHVNGDLPMYVDLGPKPRKKAEKEAWLEERSRIYEQSEKNFSAFLQKFRELRKNNPEALSGLSDIMESTGFVGEFPLGSGHGSTYWKTSGNAETEFFAHMMEARTTNPEAYAIYKEVFPESMKIWETIVNDILKGAK